MNVKNPNKEIIKRQWKIRFINVVMYRYQNFARFLYQAKLPIPDSFS